VSINSLYQLGLVKWFLLFWMCELVALTRCCKLVSFLHLISYIGDEISRLLLLLLLLLVFCCFTAGQWLPSLGRRQSTTKNSGHCCKTSLKQPSMTGAGVSWRRRAAAISLNFRDPHFGLFWGLELLLGYLATSNAKSDVGFLLGDPDFLLGRRNFAPVLLSYRDPHFGLFGFLWGFGGI